eukprot:6205366-Pleurochrysis_carterae.AAC.1
MNIIKAEGDEDSDTEMDRERQEGKREMEKLIHGIRNGEVIGGPANERREWMSRLSELGGGRDYTTRDKRGM